MNKLLLIIGIFIVLCMESCGEQKSDEILSESKLEEVLYDYHIALSMSNSLKTEDTYKKASFKNYVFQKHQITEEQFDSTMVWYTRNTGKLSEIYNRLNQRFDKEKTRFKMILADRQEGGIVSTPGDTVDIWPYLDLYWMTKYPLNNQLTFEILPDTNFYQKDAFLWKAHFNFLTEGEAFMGMNVLYTNDSIIGKVTPITQTGENELYLTTDSTYNIKSINGFIYVNGDSLQEPNVIIQNISLTKYHKSEDSVKVTKNNHVSDPSTSFELPPLPR